MQSLKGSQMDSVVFLRRTPQNPELGPTPRKEDQMLETLAVVQTYARIISKALFDQYLISFQSPSIVQSCVIRRESLSKAHQELTNARTPNYESQTRTTTGRTTGAREARVYLLQNLCCSFKTIHKTIHYQYAWWFIYDSYSIYTSYIFY